MEATSSAIGVVMVPDRPIKDGETAARWAAYVSSLCQAFIDDD